jgi:hypothetical protein
LGINRLLYILGLPPPRSHAKNNKDVNAAHLSSRDRVAPSSKCNKPSVLNRSSFKSKARRMFLPSAFVPWQHATGEDGRFGQAIEISHNRAQRQSYFAISPYEQHLFVKSWLSQACPEVVASSYPAVPPRLLLRWGVATARRHPRLRAVLPIRHPWSRLLSS